MEDKTQYDKVHTHEGFKLTKPVGGFTLSYMYMYGPFFEELKIFVSFIHEFSSKQNVDFREKFIQRKF